LEGTPTFHAEVLQRVFIKFGDSYTLLDVYNIFEKLELVYAHYEASTMRPPSRSRPKPPLVASTKSSHSSSRAKAIHLATPVLPSYNYCGNPSHKASEWNIPSEDIFCDYCGKRDVKKLFVLPSSRNGNNSDYHRKIYQHLLLPLNQKLKHLNLPLTLSPPSRTQPVQGSCLWEGPFRSFYGLSHDAMVGEYVLSSAHNYNLTPEFAISFCPSHFAAQEASVAPKVSPTRQTI